MSDNKLIAKNTLMLYFRMILIMGVTLYTSRVVLGVLGVEDFGIYNIVGGVVAMFGFLNGSLTIATQRFLTFELGKGDIDQLKRVFGVSLLIHSFLALVIILLAETIGLWFFFTKLNIPVGRFEAAMWVYQMSVLSAALTVTQVPYNAIIISYERMDAFAYISIVEVVLKLIVVFILARLDYDKLIVYSILIFFVTFFIRKLYKRYSKRIFRKTISSYMFDKTILLNVFSFSGWSLFGSVSYIAKSQGVNVLLNLFYGTTLNAAYGISQQVNTAITSFSQNFTMALNPPIVKAYAKRDLNSTCMLLFSGMKYSFYCSFLLIIPLLYETEYVLSLWLKTVPDYTVDFTRFVLIASLVDSFSYAIGATVQATGRIKWYQIIIGGILFLNLPFSYFIMKLTGEPTSALIIALALTIVAISFRFVILYKLIVFPIYKLIQLLYLVILFCLFTFPVIYLVNSCFVPSFWRLLLSYVSVFIITSWVLLSWGVTTNEREKIFLILKRFTDRILVKIRIKK